MTELATVELGESDGVLVARVRGEIDLSNVAEIRSSIERGVPTGATGVVLDLSETEYLDSAGIRLLFQLARTMTAADCIVRAVVPAGAPIRRVLELADVGQTIPIDETADDALARLAQPG